MYLDFELDFLPIDVSSKGATVRMRERIRAAIAAQCVPSPWSGPVSVEISAWHRRPFDLDNVAKQVLDSLIQPLAARDGSAFQAVAGLPDDDVRHVDAVYVRGSLEKFTKIRVKVFPTHSEETLRLDDPHLR
jgi:hypothetical protein